MSNVIEDRVLQMKFDNDNFEKNVKQSLSSLEALNKSLDNTESNGGMVKLAEGADITSSKFGALELVAIGFLTRLGAKAADVGMSMAKSLSIDQITAGWDKYASKTESVQTIMAATESTWQENAEKIGFTGSQMEFVSEQLQRLNWFSDETSYSFSDMTNNIGKFTSNGVALTDAVEAMEGISTWAALSGQNTMSASRAMYNLAQAMSTGSVKLIDWKSIENANMATTEFKQTAIDTALALGTLQQAEDGTIKTLEGNEVSVTKFNQALSDGWFSSEVLMKSLSKYGNFAVRLGEICDEYELTANQFLKGMDDYKNGSKSAADIIEELGVEITESDLISLFDELGDAAYTLGNKSFRAAQEAKTFAEAIAATQDAVSTYWMNIFETLFGNYEEAKVFWTDVTNWLWDIFAAPLDNLKTLLDGWDEFGGQQRFLKGLYNLMDIVTKVIDTVKEAFHDIFPEKTSQDLVNFTRRFMILTNNILKAEDVFKVLGSAVRAVSSVFKIFANAIKAIKVGFTEIFGGSSVFIDFIREIVREFGMFASLLSGDSKLFENIKRTAKGFFAAIDIGVNVLRGLFHIFRSVFTVITSTIKGFFNITGGIGDFIVKIDDAIRNSDSFYNSIDKISDVIRGCTNFLGTLIKSISEFFNKLFAGSPLEKAEGHFSVLSKLFELLATAASKIAPIFTKIASSIGSLVKGGLDVLINMIQNFDWGQVFNAVSAGLGIAITKFLFSGGGILDSLTGSWDALKKGVENVFNGLTNALGALEKNVEAQTIYTIAKSVAILVGSLVVLSMIDSEKIYMGVAAIGALIAELTGAMHILVGSDSATFKSALTGIMDAFSFNQKMSGMIKMAAAIAIVAFALKILASMEPEQLAVAMLALTAIIVELVAAMKILSDNSGKGNKGAKGLVSFAISMVILAAACKIFASMSWEEIAKGLVSLGVIMGAITGMSIVLTKTNSASAMKKIGAAMIPFAIGVVILGAAFKIFASMSWEELGKSMAAFAVSLGIITGMTIALSKIAGNGALAAIGLGLIAFAIGVVILGAAMKIFATMNWDEISRGFVALALALTAIGVFTTVMHYANGNGGLAATGAGLIIFAIGLAIMLPVLKGLASMSWGDLAKVGVALAGLFTIFGIGGALLRPVIPTLLKLSLVMTLMGVSLVVAAFGLAMILPIVKGFASISLRDLGQAAIVLGVLFGTLALAGIILKPAAATLLKMAAALAIIGIVLAAISFAGDMASNLLNSFVSFIETLCQALIQAAPTIFDTIVKMLDMLIDYTPQIVEKLVDLIINVIDSLASKMPEFIQAISRFLKTMFGSIGEALGGLSLNDLTLALAELAGATLMLAFVGKMGAAAIKGAVIMLAVVAIMGALLVGLGALVTYVPEIQTFLQNGIPILEQIGFALGSFFGNIVSGLMTGLTTGLPEIATNLSLFMTNLQPFLDGLNGVSPESGTAALNIAEAILALTAANLLDSIASFITGGSNLGEFAQQIVPFGAAMAEFSATVDGKINESAVESAANAGKMIAEMAKTLPNSGGVASWFAGENDLDVFADKIVPFGKAIVEFSATVDGKVNESAVQSAANAGKMLAEMATTLPNSGGVVGFFAGENDLDAFAEKIKPFGEAIAEFSAAVAGNIDEGAVEAAAAAGKMMAEMASTIPNSGGVVAFFTGDNDIDTFAAKLKPFGEAMVEFSNAVSGKVDAQAVRSAAYAGKALAEMAQAVPNEGGVVSWFTGDNDLTKFADNLKPFGTAMAEFSAEISGKIDADAITAAANAGKLIAEMAAAIPNDGGVVSWFTGNNDFSKFTDSMSSFGEGIKGFSESVKDQVDVSAVETATTAGMKIIDFASAIPNDGGVLGFFTGNNDMGEFANQFSTFGDAIKTFSSTVKGAVDTEAVSIATEAGMKIVEFASTIPNDGGALGFFAGNNDMETFSTQFTAFGTAIADFSTAVNGTVNVAAVETATTAGKSIATLAEAIKGNTGNLSKFSDDITQLGPALATYASSVANVNTDDISKVATGMDSLIALLNNVSSNAGASAKTFADALNELANSGIDKFVEAFNNAVPTVESTISNLMSKAIESVKNVDNDFSNAGSSLISKFVEGMDSNEQASTASATRIATIAADVMENMYDSFRSAGVYNMTGYINGMNSMYDNVYQAAYALGETAYNAAMAATDSNSPSKKFTQAGVFNAQGYAIGMRRSFGIVEDAASGMGEVSIDTIQSIISDISRMIDSDMDVNPTIRPVLDASEIQNGMADINNSLYGQAISIGSVSGRLSRSIGNVGRTSSSSVTNNYQTPTTNFNINGITYDDGSRVSSAVQELVSAIRMERRM